MAQASTFYIFSLSLMTLSIAGGIVNRIRDPNRIGNKALVRITQGTSLLTILFLIVLYLVVFLSFSEEILKGVFDNHISISLLLPVLIGLPFASLASGYFEGIFLSRDRYDLYIKSMILSSVVEFLFFIILVYMYELKGALLALGLGGPILLVSSLVYLKKLNEAFKSLFSFVFDFREFCVLLKFCIAVLSSSALGYFVNLWVRADVIDIFGVEKNGILQPAVAISAYSLPLVTNGIWGHLHPSASGIGDTQAGRAELNKVLRIVMLLSGALSLSGMTFSNEIIWLAYSKDFISGSELFPFQLLGDFFYFIFFSVNAYFFSTSKIRYYFSSWVTYSLFFFILTKILMSKFGILSYSLGHLGASFILFFICGGWMVRNHILTKEVVGLFFVVLSFLVLSSTAAVMDLSFGMRIGVWGIGILVLYRFFQSKNLMNF